MPVELSVIIVNYNVRFFLEQCLYSIKAASHSVDVEVIVVDNNSTDGSVHYLSKAFPDVTFISNDFNAGFSKGCNQGLAVSKGEYVLFLNPDTLIAEDSFEKCISFFKTHPDAGALGVRMIDGSGHFLKESKRSFPSPMTSLYKLFGLSMIFPDSKIFGRYHLGHLPENQNHEVDVLAGAYFMARKDIIENIGSFDETFFMYGEDVDLSYRIQQAGFKNYYFPETSIIHFKGESTRRGSLNYVRMFYNAMNIFVRKHYGGAKAGLFRFFIQVAIAVRAVVAAIAKAVRWIGIPVIDAFVILFSFWLVKEMWVNFVRTDISYPEDLLRISFPAFTLAYLVTAYYAGLYDKHYQQNNLIRSTVIATIGLLVLYSLLPESLRFSRGILLFGSMLAFVLIAVVRWLMLRAELIQEPLENIDKPFLLVAATEDEFYEIKKLLKRNNLEDKLIGRVGVDDKKGHGFGTLDSLNEISPAVGATELIFCAGKLSYKSIIEHTASKKLELRLRYHAAGSRSIVGSDSSTSTGEAISHESFMRLDLSGCRRSKRLFDGLTSLVFLLSFPLHFFLHRSPMRLFRNCVQVLAGNKTWVGYFVPLAALPDLRPGVLGSNGSKQAAAAIPLENLKLLDYWYAKNYRIADDFATVFRNYKRLSD
jgi:O-antigen biosynthesis protein